MKFEWFLLGVLVGLIPLGWHHIQVNLKLKRLVQNLRPEVLEWSISSTSKLVRAIAAQLKTQQLLERQLEALQQVFQSAPVGFLQVDEENQLIWCNLKAFELLDIQPFHLTKPRLLLELVRSYELDELIDQTRTIAKPCQRDWTFHPVFADQSKLSQQQPRSLRAYSFPLLDACVGVFLESRQETAFLAQQRDRWISDVAHELKTPLTSIRLVAETLHPRLEPPLQNLMERMLGETIRLSSLVQDLLDLTQLEAAPRRQLVLKPVDLPKLIQSAWCSLEPLARRKSLQLNYCGPPSLVIQADEARMHRVLLNLLDNSIKYSPVHESILVRVNLRAVNHLQPIQRVHLEVIDKGPGFLESDLPHVFERFYRADPSRSRSTFRLEPSSDLTLSTQNFSLDSPIPTSSGSGLGLAIVQQIVEAHQGSVEAGNYPDTHGAWLQVLLPLHPPE